MSTEKPFTIRSFRSSDREAVRQLCCDTGFLGAPIDPVYEDRQLFADFLTTYYTDWEPESSFVIEKAGEIRGYLLGSRKPLRNQLYSFWQNVSLFLKALTRYFRYNAASRRFVWWILMNGWREVRAAPRSAFSHQPSSRRAKNVDHARADECVSELSLSLRRETRLRTDRDFRKPARRTNV